MVIHHRRGFYLCPAIKSTRIGCQNFQTYRPQITTIEPRLRNTCFPCV